MPASTSEAAASVAQGEFDADDNVAATAMDGKFARRRTLGSMDFADWLEGERLPVSSSTSEAAAKQSDVDRDLHERYERLISDGSD